MAMANGNRPTMTAEVVGLEVDGDRQVFTVKVSAAHDSYNSYMVKRRYRQFDALHSTLKAGYRNLPELPGKGSMSAKDQKFLDKRKEGLSAYLRALIADPVLAGSDDVRARRSRLAATPATSFNGVSAAGAELSGVYVGGAADGQAAREGLDGTRAGGREGQGARAAAQATRGGAR